MKGGSVRGDFSLGGLGEEGFRVSKPATNMGGRRERGKD
jgi:hypothetical protein